MIYLPLFPLMKLIEFKIIFIFRRIFPRVFISVYIYMFYNVANWFMSLPEPNNAQAGLVSVVVGAGAAWFGLYVNSTGKGVETVSRNERVVKSTKKNQIG